MLQWIARARYKARKYKRVIVACEEPFAYLFEDFAKKIHTYPVKSGWRDRWTYKGKKPLPPKSIRAMYPGARIYCPTETRCKSKHAKWFRYGAGNYDDGMKGCILFHARNLPPSWHYDKKRIRGSRNWPIEKWNELRQVFENRTIISIGSKEGALHIKDTCDLRGIPLEDLCMLMANSMMLVGQSSGPHHLASLCGCKSVVWTHAIKERSLGGKTNRWRLEKGWNPFRTPVTVIDKHGWQVPVKAVARAMKEYL